MFDTAHWNGSWVFFNSSLDINVWAHQKVEWIISKNQWFWVVDI
jgi:hypothetical protein